MKVDYMLKAFGAEGAARTNMKHPNIASLELKVKSDMGEIVQYMTVEEAEHLGRELLEYTEEIKRVTETLKEMERLQA